jgi:hypothetical protein
MVTSGPTTNEAPYWNGGWAWRSNRASRSTFSGHLETAGPVRVPVSGLHGSGAAQSMADQGECTVAAEIGLAASRTRGREAEASPVR